MLQWSIIWVRSITHAKDTSRSAKIPWQASRLKLRWKLWKSGEKGKEKKITYCFEESLNNSSKNGLSQNSPSLERTQAPKPLWNVTPTWEDVSFMKIKIWGNRMDSTSFRKSNISSLQACNTEWNMVPHLQLLEKMEGKRTSKAVIPNRIYCMTLSKVTWPEELWGAALQINWNPCAKHLSLSLAQTHCQLC